MAVVYFKVLVQFLAWRSWRNHENLQAENQTTISEFEAVAVTIRRGVKLAWANGSIVILLQYAISTDVGEQQEVTE